VGASQQAITLELGQVAAKVISETENRRSARDRDLPARFEQFEDRLLSFLRHPVLILLGHGRISPSQFVRVGHQPAT
jgi:hypothetical protein